MLRYLQRVAEAAHQFHLVHPRAPCCLGEKWCLARGVRGRQRVRMRWAGGIKADNAGKISAPFPSLPNIYESLFIHFKTNGARVWQLHKLTKLYCSHLSDRPLFLGGCNCSERSEQRLPLQQCLYTQEHAPRAVIQTDCLQVILFCQLAW